MQHPFPRLLIALLGTATLCCSAPQRREIHYVADFCTAQPLVGITRDVERALALKRQRLDALSVHMGHTESRLLQQHLHGYATHWQHLHQSMNMACRDFALCRLRTGTAVSSECDGLRRRLDEVTLRTRNFLLELKQPDPDF